MTTRRSANHKPARATFKAERTTTLFPEQARPGAHCPPTIELKAIATATCERDAWGQQYDRLHLKVVENGSYTVAIDSHDGAGEADLVGKVAEAVEQYYAGAGLAIRVEQVEDMVGRAADDVFTQVASDINWA